MKAFMMLIVRPGTEVKVSDKLNKMEEVKDVSIVYGEFDIIAKVVVDSMDSLQEFMKSKIRKIKEIERTSTMVALK